jgi:hypothetical protein
MAFFGTATLLNIIQQLVVEVYDGDPESVIIQNQRTDMVVAKLIHKKEDDHDDTDGTDEGLRDAGCASERKWWSVC